MLIDTVPFHPVAGARPNFMKVAPVVRALRAHDAGLRLKLMHTKHYDPHLKGNKI